MARHKNLFETLGAAVMAVAVALAAQAQDEGGEPAVAVKPRPAEKMPLTPKSLLLDLTRAGDRFVAVGDRGAILLSPDGKAWEQVDVPVRSALTAVTFVDAERGWAVGHDAAIVATSDGGRTWSLQNFQPELEQPLLDVLFLDASRGFAAGAYSLLLQTADGGKSWTEVDAPSIRDEEGAGPHFNAMVRLGNGSLFIAGEAGMLAVSGDEGRTWSKLRSPYESSFFGALPVGERGALIFGLRGNAYTTPDVRSGRWTRLQTNSVSSMFGGTILPGGERVVVGLNGAIFVIGEGGAVSALETPIGTSLSAVVPLDGGLLAVGESGVQSAALK